MNPLPDTGLIRAHAVGVHIRARLVHVPPLGVPSSDYPGCTSALATRRKTSIQIGGCNRRN